MRSTLQRLFLEDGSLFTTKSTLFARQTGKEGIFRRYKGRKRKRAGGFGPAGVYRGKQENGRRIEGRREYVSGIERS